MNYQETIDLLDKKAKSGTINSQAVLQLLSQMNNPQNELRYLLVTGSNYRKSCSQMIAKILQSAGYKTGLFQSSYFMTFNERIKVNGEEIENNDLVSLADATKAASELIDEKCSGKDMLFAGISVYFKDFECEMAVVEIEPEIDILDAVMDVFNIECLVVTDSQNYPDLIKRTVEKNVTVVANASDNSSVNTIGQIASQFDSFEGQSFLYDGREYALSVAGEKQLKNAALAVETSKVLKLNGLKISDLSVEEGIYSASCPATFELVSDEPYFILDNAVCEIDVKNTVELINKYFTDSNMQIILSFDAECDWKKMIDCVLCDDWEYIVSGSETSVDWKEIASYIESKGFTVTGCETNDDAISVAIDASGDFGTVCAIGNDNLCGVVRSYFGLGGKNI